MERDRPVLIGFALVVVAIVTRLVQAGSSALTYNEATYADLAHHPWWSSFYPDTVFLRHPPVAFLDLALWVAIFGDHALGLRIWAALWLLVGAAFLIMAARHAGPQAAILAGFVLAASYPLLAYGMQASMYPVAFACAGATVWARVAGRRRIEGAAAALFALTHLFGFLFLAAWAWRERRDLRLVAAGTALPILWLVASSVLAVVINHDGDVMRLGPLGQAARGGATAGNAVTGPLVHLGAAALAWWSLNPVLLVRAWRERTVHPGWAVAVGILLVYFFFGAPYPRYALLVLPFVLIAGLKHVKGAVLVTALVAVSSLAAGAIYLTEGPDPRASGDVPGMHAWDEATLLLGSNGTVATSGPTAIAYYLQERGYTVTDRSQAPYRIVLQDGQDTWVVLRIDSPSKLDAPSESADWTIVPTHWDLGPGCAKVSGLQLYC